VVPKAALDEAKGQICWPRSYDDIGQSTPYHTSDKKRTSHYRGIKSDVPQVRLHVAVEQLVLLFSDTLPDSNPIPWA